MNTEMARAVNDNYKTQTRRAIVKFYDISVKNPKKHSIDIKEIPSDLEFENLQGYEYPCPMFYSKSQNKYYCSDNIKYKVNNKLWVREPAIVTNYISRFDSTKIDYQLKSDNTKEYRIDLPDRFFPNPKRWIINCKSVPNGCIKEMAKTFLIITGVRIERLQNITIGDMINEGIKINNTTSLIKENMINLSQTSSSNNLTTVEIAIKNSFIEIWNSVSPDNSKWEQNPFVTVYSFKKVGI